MAHAIKKLNKHADLTESKRAKRPRRKLSNDQHVTIGRMSQILALITAPKRQECCLLTFPSAPSALDG